MQQKEECRRHVLHADIDLVGSSCSMLQTFDEGLCDICSVANAELK
jgi:hypothetical protein